MRRLISLLILGASVTLTVMVGRVFDAGDLVKIETLGEVRIPLYIAAALSAGAVLFSIVGLIVKSGTKRLGDRLCLLVDVLSLSVIGSAFWMIMRM